MNFNDELPVYKVLIDENDNSDIEVSYVALVDRPAIQKNFIAFNEQKALFFNDERRIISGALMVADTPIYRRDKDGTEYYTVFDKETIYKIAQKFHRKGYQANVNLMHDAKQTVDGVVMFESFITDSERGIMPMKGFEDVPNGSWFGSFHVENSAVWELVKSFDLRGFSVEGFFNLAKTNTTKEDYTDDQFLNEIKKIVEIK